MLTATKTIRFDAAHVLTNHRGMCKNLHGHTYRVEVSVTHSPEDRSDMVIDFKDLKHVLEEEVAGRFDHAFIYDSTSEAESDIAATVSRHGMRVTAIPFRSTAENLARYIFERVRSRLPGISAVKVYETPDSCAEYRI